MAAKPTVEAGPTKRFFVTMLTRDIGLEDAILDLLDNCIDGILRERRGKPATPAPYKGYWAKIVATPTKFEIWDNCGGIPLEVARKSAFMLGRPDIEKDTDIATVGMYGIGMKRAIFKMGRASTVTSEHADAAYRVEITPSWLEDDGNWRLPLQTNVRGFARDGTKIVVTDLYEAIAHQFSSDRSEFLGTLRKEISRLFALIMEKGFEVFLNDEKIKPVELLLLAPPKDIGTDKGVIRPYVFQGEIDRVNVSMVVGFYRPLATEAEINAEQEQPRSKDEAGWTIICNDRIVLHADKSGVTGWGTADVPRYHNQFIAISGVVTFTSNVSFALPLNTTKRGIDISSSVYLFVLDYMREGVKKFTDFTNKWKTRTEETNAAFAQLERKRPQDIAKLVTDSAWTAIRKAADRGTAKRYLPDLPVPEDKERNRRISFSRPDADVKKVAKALFDDTSVPPSEVGARCFDDFLSKGKK
jgi:hypothetical protein